MKIYGFKESDVLGLIEFVNKNGEGNKTQRFREYAKKTGKAVGTVRNLYYEIAKKSKTDNKFSCSTTNSNAFKVNKITPFSAEEEKRVAEQIISLTSKGYSVRGASLELAKGDAVLALRYQNKFRSLVKRQDAIISKAVNGVDAPLLTKLKKDIDELVDKIGDSVKKENAYLKEKLCKITKERDYLLTLCGGKTLTHQG